jgi:phage baseplate assembly protein W
MNPREKLFGNDLKLAERSNGFDLQSGLRGDLALAQGNDNIIQALTLRLLVRKGELARLGLPEYGSRLHELIGSPNNTRTHIKLMAFARSALEQDRRVLKISSIQAKITERTVVTLSIDLLLIDQPTPRNLVLDVQL